MKFSNRILDIKVSVNNILAIEDILESFETELRFKNVDFEDFLKTFGWTSEEYSLMWQDLDKLLTQEEINEQYCYSHTWKHETDNNISFEG